MSAGSPGDASGVPWTIRAACDDDVAGIVDLFAEAYGKEITAAHWRWKLTGLPSPVDNVWIALDGSRPIFHYAGILVPFQFPTGQSQVMISTDSMTAPAYRRRGLLTTVVPRLFDSWRAAGIPLTLGLPNERWGSRRSAIGWQLLFPLRWLRFPLRLESLAGRKLHLDGLAHLHAASTLWQRFWRSRAALDPGVEVARVDEAGSLFDRLWAQRAGDVPFSVVRDGRWVTWRYLSSPMMHYEVLLASRDGEPVGYSVVGYGRRDHTQMAPQAGGRGYIVEMLVAQDDRAAVDTLIVRTLQAMAAAGFDQALTLAVPGTTLDAAWQRLGFRPAWGAFDVCYVPLADDLPAEIIGSPANWHIAGGDFDIV